MKIDPFKKQKGRNQAKSRAKLIEATEIALTKALKTPPFVHAIFRYDLFAHQILVCHPIPPAEDDPGWVARPLTDTDITALMLWFQDNGYVKVSASRVQRAVEWEANLNAFNPVQDALKALPAWDGTVRLDAFFRDVCGAEIAEEGMTDQEVIDKDALTSAIGRCFFIGLVARIMAPGCKNDTMLILEGEQGEMKSTLLNQLCLEPRWFSDTMPHDVTNKDAQQHMLGALIIEMAELNQMGKSKVDAFKSFLTVKTDKYRPPYGHNPIIQPRGCIFVGTTNHHTYFTDETGNRRFWPIKCGTINLGLAALIKDQLYAEALVAYKAGEKWWLTKDLEILARVEQDQRLTDDPWDNAVQTVVDAARKRAKAHTRSVFFVTVVDALQAIEIKAGDWTPQMQSRIRKILKKKGGKNNHLPRGEGYPDYGYRFVIASNGHDEDRSPRSARSANPLN